MYCLLLWVGIVSGKVIYIVASSEPVSDCLTPDEYQYNGLVQELYDRKKTLTVGL